MDNTCVLATTGLNLWPFVAVAAALLAGGVVAVLFARRRVAPVLAALAIAVLVIGGVVLAPTQSASAACITANTAPVANADSISIKEDTAPNPVTGNVLANDTDADGDTLTVTDAGTHPIADGTLTLGASGSYSYELDDAAPAVDALNDGETLTDTFIYAISDGHGGTASAALTVTINGTTDVVVNTPPVAAPDVVGIKEDTPPNPVTGNVLSNDSDADADSLSVTNAGTFDLGHGDLVINADGSYSYTLDNSNPAVNALNDGQSLTDTFTYDISDGHGGTDSATLQIIVNGSTDAPANTPPVAVADVNNIKEDAAPNPITGNVLTNDSDADGNAISVTNAGTFDLGYGGLVINADGAYSYTLDNSNPAVNALNDGQSLTDTFTYTISDGHGGTDSSTLSITINGTTDNQPPVALADVNSVTEDVAPNPIVGNVLTNDSDPDGDTVSVTNAGTFNLGHGVLVLHADGSYSYTLDNSNPAVNALNDGQSLTDTFTYTISDGHGGTDSSTLTITINGTTDEIP